ncbi:hypothetical protein M407DRAFT_242142 [Tulasnella calospora MUT 4182]|uniref:Uncharacterized protein n=1 Tax=Tulasnella calospora MUT 4182 TaxID=1051891 RepID=A0A0C3L9N9_9AGAM|nr:hypothetical protein M407DRAFT_242142 [Tulasnella calospora MUT 4182]
MSFWEILRNEWRSGELSGMESWVSVSPNEGEQDQHRRNNQFQYNLTHSNMARAAFGEQATCIIHKQPVHTNVERGKKHEGKRETWTVGQNNRNAAVQAL